MSIFRMCCERKKSEDLNQTDEIYDNTKSNLNSELEDGVLVAKNSSTVDSFIKVAQFKRDEQQVDENFKDAENPQVVEEVLVAKKTNAVESFIRVASFERDGQELDDNGAYKDVW